MYIENSQNLEIEKLEKKFKKLGKNLIFFKIEYKHIYFNFSLKSKISEFGNWRIKK